MRGVLKKTAIILLSLCFCFVLLAVSSYIYMKISAPKAPESGAAENISARTEMPASETGIKTASAMEDMLETALESVVGISSATNGPTEKNKGATEQWYMGSGVLATEDGYIITNQHVVGARPQRILVTLYNGETTEGKTVWSDASLDLAVVKIDGSGYKTSQLGDAKQLRVGESVAAIGNPLSMQFQRTVTAGIVSAVGRCINIENDG